jgi:LmbE family N-acetylglucosaminyl deacetylase
VREKPRHNPDWRWDETLIRTHPTPDHHPHPHADHDTDRRIVGTILDAKGKPLHTVKRAGSVEFGYRRP